MISNSIDILKNFFAQSVLEDAANYAKSKPLEEACGVIVDDPKHGHQFFELKNVADDSSKGFEIEPNEWVRIYSNEKILAIFHSHIGEDQPGFLSTYDVHQSNYFKIPYLLYHIDDQEWDYYDSALIHPRPLQEKGTPKELPYYLGWNWEWVRCDCSTLLRAYYKGMLGIHLNDYPKPLNPKEILSSNWNGYLDNFESEGFVRVYDAIKPNDVILMNLFARNPHHVGIVTEVRMDNSVIMLHLFDDTSPSNITLYGGFWRQCEHSRWRHKNFM